MLDEGGDCGADEVVDLRGWGFSDLVSSGRRFNFGGLTLLLVGGLEVFE